MVWAAVHDRAVDDPPLAPGGFPQLQIGEIRKTIPSVDLDRLRVGVAEDEDALLVGTLRFDIHCHAQPEVIGRRRADDGRLGGDLVASPIQIVVGFVADDVVVDVRSQRANQVRVGLEGEVMLPNAKPDLGHGEQQQERKAECDGRKDGFASQFWPPHRAGIRWRPSRFACATFVRQIGGTSRAIRSTCIYFPFTRWLAQSRLRETRWAARPLSSGHKKLIRSDTAVTPKDEDLHY